MQVNKYLNNLIRDCPRTGTWSSFWIILAAFRPPQFGGAIYTVDIAPKWESKIGSKEPKNRQKPSLWTVSNGNRQIAVNLRIRYHIFL
jgi:hypothetical protein